MPLKVEIDPSSGFCNGVVRAVGKAEEYLASSGHLYSLGAIVHNSSELDRLCAKGLEIIGREEFDNLRGGTVLIRAHGEPPSTYETASANSIEIIDCTCPVVLALQRKVRKVFLRMEKEGGQVVIFGRDGHAEVNGLVGQTDGKAIVVGSLEGIRKIDFSRPVALFSQTTKDPEEYAALAAEVRRRRPDAEVYNTICRQVASRHKSLVAFAESHDVIVFVSGRESSNGKVLFDLCRSVNPRCFMVEDATGQRPDMFRDGDSVGVCGATSTPQWQLEEVAEEINRAAF
ncbi:MAG: 4-hydroxy-3-methylbut-2-enyl diphosphate reductase [Bacteroidales bacterium]|nr:4-hydroxy-3-methylbut-2-enyl diphosphate reductase [Bacteroidales bacterium]